MNALGALGPVDGVNPELSNLTCSMTYVEPGDIVFLTSDGISDNFDPVVGKFCVPKRTDNIKPGKLQIVDILSILSFFRIHCLVSTLSLFYLTTSAISLILVIKNILSILIDFDKFWYMYFERYWSILADFCQSNQF